MARINTNVSAMIANNNLNKSLNINTSAVGGAATYFILNSVLGVPQFGSGGANLNQNPNGGGSQGSFGGQSGPSSPGTVNPPAAAGDGVSPSIYQEGATTLRQDESGASVIKGIFEFGAEAVKFIKP